MVFCDLSKAFDRVWHKGLLFKLHTYGIRGNIYQWFTNYLSCRCQKVMFKDQLSSSANLNAGVPQGSVLGPLLFLIYVNDVAENMVSLCRLFADDNSIQHASNNPSEIEFTLNHDLCVLDEWSKKWLLKFNPSKTKAVFFSLNKNIGLPKLFFQNCQLEYVSVHKHLGLFVSHDLGWFHYINTITNAAYKKLGLLKKLKFTLGRNTLLKMYTTFVRPALEYASVVWDGCNSYECDLLEKVQLCAARIITGLPILASRDSLYLETGLEPLVSRRKTAKLVTMYKIHNNEVPQYLKETIPSKVNNKSSYNLRNGDNYNIPKCRLELYKKSFVPDSISKWNSLSTELRQATSIKQFRKGVSSNNFNNPKPPVYFSYGRRMLNIIHTKLRHKCILKYDLYRRNIVDSPLCSCGIQEDAYHFFFTCNKYSKFRYKLMDNLLRLKDLNIIDTHLLLWGNDVLSTEVNNCIFSYVQTYIHETNRFI